MPLALAEFDKPVIAALNGPASGAGLDMALMCDMRIASERATFAESINVGLVPGDGGAFYLPRIVGLPMACELLFSGRPVDATEALRIGLVNRVVPPDELLPASYELADRIASRPLTALRLTKRLIYAGLDSDLKTSLDLSSSFIAHVLDLDETGAAMAFVLDRLSKSKPKRESGS